METVIQILEAEELTPIMYIPPEMRHGRLEVTIRPVEKAASLSPAPIINKEIMLKFQQNAELGEAKKHLKKKLAEGAQFDFDATKLINGTMNRNDWQNLNTLQKQAWQKAALKKYGNSNNA